MDILDLINKLRETDRYIETIYLNGGCYQFHLFLESLFPECMAYINEDKNHIISKYQGKFYDITGEVDPTGFRPLRAGEFRQVEKWSFAKYSYLTVEECPHCLEPLLIEP